MSRRNQKFAIEDEIAFARQLWPILTDRQTKQLRSLLQRRQVSLLAGDVQLLGGKFYITHSGLLRISRENRCNGIHTETVPEYCDPRANRWVVKATVFKTSRSRGFIGYGDADPTNVSPLVRGAEMRVAETRAVNRALRKAYGIGLCSVEELGTGDASALPEAAPESDDGNGNGRPRLRDRLLLLIRQYQLNAEHVKCYAARFCGTTSLREATREQVESFINHLASRAAEDRDKLLADMSAGNQQPAIAQKLGGNASTEEAA